MYGEKMFLKKLHIAMLCVFFSIDAKQKEIYIYIYVFGN